VRPSLEDIEAFIATYQNLPEEERQTHFQMQTTADEAEIKVILSMLAGESSESTRTELVSAAARHVFGEDEGACIPGGVRRKRLCRTGHPAVSTEGKKRKRRLQRSSGLELRADSIAPVLDGGPASANLEDDIESYGSTRAGGRVSDKDEEDEEEVSPLICKNCRSKNSDDVAIQALSGMVNLQRLTMSAIDHALEEIIPKDLLLELLETERAAIHTEVLDDAPSASNLVGQEITRIVSHASSTFEGGLIHRNTLVPNVTCKGYPALVGTIEDASAPEGAAEDDPAPEGVELGSSLAASMDVHVGSPPVQSEEPVLTCLPTALVVPITLKVSDPGARNPLHAVGDEVPLSVALGTSSNPPLGLKSTLNIASASTLPSDSLSMPPALGFPLFLSNLQVS
jgi:hypothetical protein